MAMIVASSTGLDAVLLHAGAASISPVVLFYGSDLPPSVNRTYRSGRTPVPTADSCDLSLEDFRNGAGSRACFFQDPKAADWKLTMKQSLPWIMRSAGVRSFPVLRQNVSLMTVWFLDARSDIGNREKLFHDSLEGSLYENDRLILRDARWKFSRSRAVDRGWCCIAGEGETIFRRYLQLLLDLDMEGCASPQLLAEAVRAHEERL